MVIIRCNVPLKKDVLQRMREAFVAMAKDGVILLPDFCELVNEVPPDTDIVVVSERSKK